MTGIVQALAYAVLVGFAVLGALEVDRRLAGCPDRGFITIATKPSARGWLDSEAAIRRIDRQYPFRQERDHEHRRRHAG